MGKKILLADDSITIQKVIELTFSDEDFEVVTVGNGRLALEKLADARPDIVLCDINMPEKDGYAVCEQIKSSPDTAHIPVLLLTGAFEPFDAERATSAGSDGHLAKPFEPETLIAKVKDLLARAPARTSPPLSAPRPAAPASPSAPTLPPSPPPARPTPPSWAAPPSAPPSPERPPAVPSFVPEEPFDAFDAESMEEQPADEPEPLAPVTPEEAATLAGEPPAGASAPADAASTVMFRPDELPWTSAQPPPRRPSVEGELPDLRPRPDFAPAQSRGEPEAEPFLTPYPGDEGEEGGAAFEEVLEEDLDLGGGGYPPAEAPASPKEESETVMYAPPPAAPEPRRESPDEASTGRFAAVSVPRESATETAPPLPPSEEMAETPVVPAPPTRPTGTLAPPLEGAEPPELEPESFQEEPSPERPGRPSWPSGTPRAESFADVAPPAAEPKVAATAPSEAASVPVPIDMVEKIAQRVVAQVSERVVREIAWDVFPDLAEALIKQEIERLKAELKKL